MRLGNPLGLTYKKYFGSKALEFGIGSSGDGWNRGYYENSFEGKDKFNGYNYRSHRLKSSLYLQGRYLVHNEIYVQGLEGEWDWYWGIGGVLKFASVRYRYINDSGAVQEETYSDIDLGPEGIAGMEYTFQDVPVAIFGEISLMMEIVDRLTLQPFGAVGVRYNF